MGRAGFRARAREHFVPNATIEQMHTMTQGTNEALRTRGGRERIVKGNVEKVEEMDARDVVGRVKDMMGHHETAAKKCHELEILLAKERARTRDAAGKHDAQVAMNERLQNARGADDRRSKAKLEDAVAKATRAMADQHHAELTALRRDLEDMLSETARTREERDQLAAERDDANEKARDAELELERERNEHQRALDSAFAAGDAAIANEGRVKAERNAIKDKQLELERALAVGGARATELEIELRAALAEVEVQKARWLPEQLAREAAEQRSALEATERATREAELREVKVRLRAFSAEATTAATVAPSSAATAVPEEVGAPPVLRPRLLPAVPALAAMGASVTFERPSPLKLEQSPRLTAKQLRKPSAARTPASSPRPRVGILRARRGQLGQEQE